MKTSFLQLRPSVAGQLRRGGDGALSPPGGGPGSVSAIAFTLIELLVVISILGLLAALAMPVINNFKPNYAASATRQLLDDLARARQLAISQRTTVYMVFVPATFWNDSAYGVGWTPADFTQASNLFDKQLVGYNFVSLRSVGDQPGSPTVRYLGPWKTLPEGSFIPLAKTNVYAPNVPVMQFYTNDSSMNPVLAFNVYGFHRTDRFTPVPFPTATVPGFSPAHPYINLPYIAFDYTGRLVSGVDEIIPLGKGNVTYSRDPATKIARRDPPSVTESPPGNTTNAFNLVYIEWLTGRAHIERQEVR